MRSLSGYHIPLQELADLYVAITGNPVVFDEHLLTLVLEREDFSFNDDGELCVDPIGFSKPGYQQMFDEVQDMVFDFAERGEWYTRLVWSEGFDPDSFAEEPDNEYG